MKKLYNLINQKSEILIFTATAIVLLPFIILSFYNHPASDDFCYTNYIRDNEFWAAQVKHYFIWTGRFTATFLLTIDPIELNDLSSYQLLPVALFILFCASILIFVKSFFPKISLSDRLLLSFLILFLYIYYIPDTAEAFYWRAGSLTYQLASVLTLLLFATIKQLQRLQSTFKRSYLTVLACLLSIMAIGLNETSMVIIFVVVILWTTGWFLARKSKRLEMTVILFIIIAATAIVILAPGNAVRMAEKPQKFQFLFSLVGAVKITLVNLLRWIPMTVLLLALFSPLFDRMSRRVRNRYDLSWINLRHLGFCAIFLFCFIVLCFFPSFWSQGGRPPYRTINVIYLLYIVGSFFLTILFFSYLQNRKKTIPQIPKKIQLTLFIIVLSIVIIKPNNIKEAYSDLFTGTAFHYDQEMKKRYKILEKCSSRSCTVPALKNKPRTILSSDLSGNPEHESFYYNSCIADHFGIEKVFLPKNETSHGELH
ncbi:hypothetical protein SAMN04488034_101891 [Salinimicrobium catena]|uniref:Glucosyl transferase GtrII n=1 Tax=Salinimicrobium catena TaxID=390640 RepID=A0A1H5JXF9_9FLAO|nr:DUF6056 family protein [Salinimicrobium catena]SDK91304.1 hypothetical protein SAMN04488140_101877 [Salinimicrobium catena]SEE57024.1 hypothetical protein SAMN04488034_101891 [Salinimicrobium catena]